MDAGVIVGIVAVAVSAFALLYTVIVGRSQRKALDTEARDRREGLALLRRQVEAQDARIRAEGSPIIKIEKTPAASSVPEYHEIKIGVFNDGGATAVGLVVVAIAKGEDVATFSATVPSRESRWGTIRIPRGEDPATGKPDAFPTDLRLEARLDGAVVAAWP